MNIDSTTKYWHYWTCINTPMQEFSLDQLSGQEGSDDTTDAGLSPVSKPRKQTKLQSNSVRAPERRSEGPTTSLSGEPTAKDALQKGLSDVKRMNYLEAIDLLYNGCLDSQAADWVRQQRRDPTTPIGAFFDKIRRREEKWLG